MSLSDRITQARYDSAARRAARRQRRESAIDKAVYSTADQFDLELHELTRHSMYVDVLHVLSTDVRAQDRTV